MAFNPSGTNYQLGLRQAALDRTTEADLGKLKRERADRVRKSGERSGLQKLLSAGVRGAAAYYTGGMSEQMGMGGAIDSAMLGTDSEGRAVRNEYGDLVGTGASVYQAGKSMKDAKLAKQDAKFDKLRSKRMDIVNTLFDAGMDEKAMEGLKDIENMETGYMSKRKEMEGGWNPFAHSDEDYSALQPTGMNKAQREAREEQLNQAAKGQTGEDTSYDISGRDSGFFSRHRPESAKYAPSLADMEARDLEISGAKPPASAPHAPSLADMEIRRLEKIKADRESLKGMRGPQ